MAAVSAATAASFSAALLGFWAEGLAITGDQVQCPMCEEPTLSDRHKAVLRDRIATSAELVAATGQLTSACQSWEIAFTPAVSAVTALGIRGLNDKGRETLATILGHHEHLRDFLNAHDAFLIRKRELGEALRRNKELGTDTKDRAGSAPALPALVEDRKPPEMRWKARSPS